MNVSSPQSIPRRHFLLRSATAGIGLPLLAPRHVLGQPGRPAANSRFGIGFIGTGRQAFHANLPPFLVSPD